MHKVVVNLSIIIVNYKSESLILDCLRSLKSYIKDDAFEIIIIDNGLEWDSQQKVTQQFPKIKWINMTYNSGFARANNAGIKVAKGSAVLLLNPDTLAVDNSIEKCYAQLMDSEYVAAGVQLLDMNNQPQISGNFFVRGGLNHLLPIPYWGTFIRWLGYKAGSKVPNVQQAKEIEEVDWISGAFLMVKKEGLEKAGLMDEDFFLYAEEIEWCSRLKKVGNLCIFGKLHIIHLEGATINKSQNLQEKGYYNLYDKKGLQLIVSNHVRVRKQYGVLWFLVLLMNYTWGIAIFFIGSFLKGIFIVSNPFNEWKKAGAFAKNVFRLWMLAPTIIRNKPYFYKMF